MGNNTKLQNTILYVDDEIINLDVFEATFEDEYHILLASSAKIALDILSQNKIQLVITDQRMPGMTGIEFIEMAHQQYPDIVFMILSAYADFEIASQTIENGGIERFLIKPWKKLELKFEINKAIEKHELIRKNKDLLNNLEGLNRELIELKDKLKDEIVYLKEEIKPNHNFENIISHDKNFKKVLNRIEQVAVTDSTVLILGETGTGKELIAKAVHNISKRNNKPFIKLNCSTIPAALIESELFGHEKGAFTGALNQKIGKFELADTGTIFLDEIGELSLDLQPKLLRVLQEGEIERLGGTKTIKVDIRVLAATNRNLEEEVNKKSFRSDLYYRLNVFPVTAPALRERKSDIPHLVKHFMSKYNAQYGKNISRISQVALKKLQDYNWPGNIRELENIIERAAIISHSGKLNIEEVMPVQNIRIENDEIFSLEEVERQHIFKVLKKTQGRIAGKNGAAKLLNINRTTLNARMQKMGIKKHDFLSVHLNSK